MLLVSLGWGGGVVSYKRLMGMSRWMGSHFHDWIDYNGVANTNLTTLLKNQSAITYISLKCASSQISGVR